MHFWHDMYVRRDVDDNINVNYICLCPSKSLSISISVSISISISISINISVSIGVIRSISISITISASRSFSVYVHLHHYLSTHHTDSSTKSVPECFSCSFFRSTGEISAETSKGSEDYRGRHTRLLHTPH